MGAKIHFGLSSVMLEAVFVLNTTLASVRAIATWIEQQHSKQQKLRQLKRTVESLSLVLEPLHPSSATVPLDKSIVALLYDVAEILNGVKEHLMLCSGKAKKSKMINAISLLNPSVALGMLYDDERRLSQWISLFTMSLQIATLKGQAENNNNALTTTASTPPQATLKLDWLPSNDDISSFWMSSFGEESVFVSSDEFMVALEKWIQDPLDEIIRNALLLELDRQSIGGVTRRTLDGFACERTLKDSVDDLRSQYTMTDNSLSPISLQMASPALTTSSLSPSTPSMSLEPTLVWIDDKMTNNQAEVNYAISRHIRVIQLPTTAIAKLWIEQSETELRLLESHHLVQFITDNARWEVPTTQVDAGPGGPSSLNMSAGETILRYLRGRGFKAPVLVYCGRSIPLTEYVKVYSHAASTADAVVCLGFMEWLVEMRTTIEEDGVVVADSEEKREEFRSSFGVGRGFKLVS